MKKGKVAKLRRTSGVGGTRSTGAVATLCLVQFTDVLGVTVVVTALPAMLAGLHAPASAAGLVSTGYAMCFGGLLMLGARLGDRFGHRRVLLCGLGLFGAASALAAAAPDVAVLVAGRSLQGAAAAASVPAALRLLNAAAPEGEARRRGLAAWSAAGAAAGAGGFALGGALTGALGWRSLFWVDVPLAAALAVAVRRWAPAPPAGVARRLDLPGALALTGAVMGAVLGGALLAEAGRRALGALAVAAAAALVAVLVVVERRTPEPLLPGAALRDRRLRAGVAAAALNTATTSSAVTLATLRLQGEEGLGPGAAALRLVPFSVGVVAGAALAAPLLRRSGARTAIALGLTAVAAGVALLLAGPGPLPAAAAVAGAGIGISSVGANALGTSVAPELQGTAAGALNTAAQLGTALGVAFLLALASATSTATAWIAAALLALTGAALLRRPVTEPASSRGSGALQGATSNSQ
jgi:MFS family permease